MLRYNMSVSFSQRQPVRLDRQDTDRSTYDSSQVKVKQASKSQSQLSQLSQFESSASHQ